MTRPTPRSAHRELPQDATGRARVPQRAVPPRTMMHLTPTEQVLVLMIRRVASGQSMGTLVGMALEYFCPRLAESIARTVFAVARALDDATGPDIALHPVHCRRISADEITVLRMVAAMRNLDADSARAFAGCLVGPARVPVLLTQTGALALHLPGEFRVDPVAPRPAWGAA